MEDIVKQFLEEVSDIEKSSLFMVDDEDEPTTEWVEEIDPRTNFPFYWNSTTKESVWDRPESYDEYLMDYERYLKNLMDLQCIERAREQHEDDLKKRSDMRGLLGYSDSEDESTKESIVEEVKVTEELTAIKECEQGESVSSKKERWMGEQVVLARQYLHNLIKNMSETTLKKIQLLPKDVPNSDILTPIGLRVQTRLEDWEGGHLTIERTVEKLQEALVNISKFEGDLESANCKLSFDKDTMRYYFVDSITGKKKLSFSINKSIYEDGEIVDDEEDLTSDLHEYVISTLHRSLVEDVQENVEECFNSDTKLEILKNIDTQWANAEQLILGHQEICKVDDGEVSSMHENFSTKIIGNSVSVVVESENRLLDGNKKVDIIEESRFQITAKESEGRKEETNVVEDVSVYIVEGDRCSMNEDIMDTDEHIEDDVKDKEDVEVVPCECSAVSMHVDVDEDAGFSLLVDNNLSLTEDIDRVYLIKCEDKTTEKNIDNGSTDIREKCVVEDYGTIVTEEGGLENAVIEGEGEHRGVDKEMKQERKSVDEEMEGEYENVNKDMEGEPVGVEEEMEEEYENIGNGMEGEYINVGKGREGEHDGVDKEMEGGYASVSEEMEKEYENVRKGLGNEHDKEREGCHVSVHEEMEEKFENIGDGMTEEYEDVRKEGEGEDDNADKERERKSKDIDTEKGGKCGNVNEDMDRYHGIVDKEKEDECGNVVIGMAREHDNAAKEREGKSKKIEREISGVCGNVNTEIERDHGGVEKGNEEGSGNVIMVMGRQHGNAVTEMEEEHDAIDKEMEVEHRKLIQLVAYLEDDDDSSDND